MFYKVTYVIGSYIYPRNPTDTVRITGSFAQFFKYDQSLLLSTSQCIYVYQENQSAILLETNSFKSVGKNSRRIKSSISLSPTKLRIHN